MRRKEGDSGNPLEFAEAAERKELRAVRVAVDLVMPRQSPELEVRRSGFTFGE